MIASAQKDIVTSDPFRRRALAEAARYGSDPWVFVRELLQNARDAGAGLVELTVSEDGHWERLTCRDDGCGIPADQISRVFDPFFTTKQVGEGTGLGLSISYQIVKQHGGDISVESAPGEGTCFRVELPSADSADSELD